MRPFFQLLSVVTAVFFTACQQNDGHDPVTLGKLQQESIPTYATLNDIVSEQGELDAEVVNELLYHPEFQNIPPVVATTGRKLSEDGNGISEESLRFRNLGKGWVHETSTYRASGGSWEQYESNGYAVSLLAGLVPLANWSESISTWEDNAPEVESYGARISKINSITGAMFPLAVGNSLSIDLARTLWENKKPVRSTLEYRVVRMVDGRSIGIPRDEEVFEIVNTITVFNENPVSQSGRENGRENNYYYVPSLGIAIRSDKYSSEYPDIKTAWPTLD